MTKIAVEKLETPEKAKERRKMYADIFAKHSVDGCIIYAEYEFVSEAFEDEEQARKLCQEMETKKAKGSPMRWEYVVETDVVKNKYYVCGNYINIFTI